MLLSAVYRLRRYLMAFRRWGASSNEEVGEISCFLSLTLNISKTVADTAKITIND